MAIESINPATEEVLATYSAFTEEQVDQALAETFHAFTEWRGYSLTRRADRMRAAGRYLRENKAPLGRLITLEMGKPLAQAESEVEKCAWNCDFYAEHAAAFMADRHVATNALDSYVTFEPLGVVLAVMPWNFPFWQVFRFAAPGLMAGNTAVLKHASNVPQCALAIEEVFRSAGFPPGAFRTVLVTGAAAEPIIADPRVRAVTLTGSDVTGSQIAAVAGRYLKKTVLELGGSDPFIVLADADLTAAAQVGAMARCQNTGQSCIAAKRFIVVEAVAAAFEREFTEAVARLSVGDPLRPEVQVGPLARGDLRVQLERQVRESVGAGARILTGGEPLPGRGFFYAPTVLVDVTESMPVWREETFGPVAAIRRVPDEEAAIRAANDSLYGLGASLWTTDLDRARRLAGQLEAGSVFVNGMVASDPRLPFGGIKRSGYGRELSEFGLLEFVNVKTVWVGPAGGQQTASAPSE